MSIALGLIVFFTWLIPLINLPVQIAFWVTEIKSSISTESMFSLVWAIIAFWYWYKKYERDKEIELIKKFTISDSIILEYENSPSKLIFDWYQYKIFSDKWYIKPYLWESIEITFKIVLQNISLKLISQNKDGIELLTLFWKLILYPSSRKYFLKIINKDLKEYCEWQINNFLQLDENRFKIAILNHKRIVSAISEFQILLEPTTP